MRKIISMFLLTTVLLTGCFPKPEIRWGQAKVPDVPKEHPLKVEGERQAGEYLATVVEPEEQKVVAVALSTSLGAADKVPETPQEIVETLRKGQTKDRATQQKFEDRVDKFAGKKIEDTGWNVLPSFTGLGFILIIAACIFVPGFGSLVMFLFRRLRGTTQQLVDGISQFEASDPVAAAKLKDYLSKNMDRSQKLLVRKLK